MSDLTINQHYISECILGNFSNKNNQVYECLVNKGKIYLTNIRNSMMNRYTYEHPYFETNRIEKWFCEIEDYAGPEIKQIITTIDNHVASDTEFKLIRDLVNKDLSTFIIFYYRSGALLLEYSFGQKNKDDRILSMREKLVNSNYIGALAKSIIKNYNFAIIRSTEGEFLMSDQYISTAALSIKNKFLKISNRHMGLKDTIILIPISKNYYVVYFHGNVPPYIMKNKINILNEFQISEINGIIINNTYQKCVSNNKESILKAMKQYEYFSPSEILGGSHNGSSLGATLKKEVFFYYRDKKAWELIDSYPEWNIYNNVNRNDLCPCGSNKKYKKCCLEALPIAKSIIEPFAVKQAFPFALIDMEKDAICATATIEEPIIEFMSKLIRRNQEGHEE